MDARGWEMDVSAQEERGGFALPSRFCSVWALSGLKESCLHWGGADPPYSVTELNGSILQCTLRDALRNNVSPTLWASLSPVRLTHKINHHTIFRG